MKQNGNEDLWIHQPRAYQSLKDSYSHSRMKSRALNDPVERKQTLLEVVEIYTCVVETWKMVGGSDCFISWCSTNEPVLLLLFKTSFCSKCWGLDSWIWQSVEVKEMRFFFFLRFSFSSFRVMERTLCLGSHEGTTVRRILENSFELEVVMADCLQSDYSSRLPLLPK